MKLISCPACQREISSAAESCPQCGHPNRIEKKKHVETCYECGREATQRCHHCGAFSCVSHLETTGTQHGSALLCTKCCESQQKWNVLAYAIAGFGIIGLLILLSK